MIKSMRIRIGPHLNDFDQSRLQKSPTPALDPNAERAKVLATLALKSAEWKALHGEIEAEEDKRFKTR
jgi:hypothetical protein